MLKWIRDPGQGRLNPIVWLLLTVIACLLAGLAYDSVQVPMVTCVRVEAAEVNCVTEKKVLALLPVGKPGTHLQVRRAILVNSCDTIESENCAEWIDVETARGRSTLMNTGMFAPPDIAEQINALIRNPSKQSYQTADYSKLIFVFTVAVGVAVVWLWTRVRRKSN